jgi:transposase
VAPTPQEPAELVADKGYHSRDGLKGLEDGAWKSRIAEKKGTGVSRWHGDTEARRAVGTCPRAGQGPDPGNNRARLRSGMAKEAFRLRAELCERSFALVLDRGSMRRAWLRGRENLHKRYLVHVAGYNLGLIMRLLVGAGTPRECLAGGSAHLLALAIADSAVLAILTVPTGTEAVLLVISLEPEPHRRSRTSSTAW